MHERKPRDDNEAGRSHSREKNEDSGRRQT
jgi:hypothetical protein